MVTLRVSGLSRESEALRLLRLARASRPVLPPVDELLARHRELVASGVELPAWASHWAPPGPVPDRLLL